MVAIEIPEKRPFTSGRIGSGAGLAAPPAPDGQKRALRQPNDSPERGRSAPCQPNAVAKPASIRDHDRILIVEGAKQSEDGG